MDFGGRECVVTGGTGALGRAVVARLLSGGAHVTIPVYRAAELAGFAHREDPRVTTVAGIDLTNEDQVAVLYERVAGRLWGSIHLVGGFALQPLSETTATDFLGQFQLNTLTAFLCTRAALQSIDGAGRIVNVAARPALEPRQGAGMVAYTVSKAAVAALTVAAAEEVAAAGRAVWINAVAPAIIDTPANRAAQPAADFGTWPKPEELAETIVFLASPDNRVARGGIVPVYGNA